MIYQPQPIPTLQRFYARISERDLDIDLYFIDMFIRATFHDAMPLELANIIAKPVGAKFGIFGSFADFRAVHDPRLMARENGTELWSSSNCHYIVADGRVVTAYGYHGQNRYREIRDGGMNAYIRNGMASAAVMLHYLQS